MLEEIWNKKFVLRHNQTDAYFELQQRLFINLASEMWQLSFK